jgi:hypothetical protein
MVLVIPLLDWHPPILHEQLQNGFGFLPIPLVVLNIAEIWIAK